MIVMLLKTSVSIGQFLRRRFYQRDKPFSVKEITFFPSDPTICVSTSKALSESLHCCLTY